MKKIDQKIAKAHTLLAFEDYFESEAEFNLYCENIKDKEELELFLYVGSIYCSFAVIFSFDASVESSRLFFAVRRNSSSALASISFRCFSPIERSRL